MIENKTLSLFKHDQPIYQNDLINWLDKNTKITCSEDEKTTFKKAITIISNYDTPTA